MNAHKLNTVCAPTFVCISQQYKVKPVSYLCIIIVQMLFVLYVTIRTGVVI